MKKDLINIIANKNNRIDIWIEFINYHSINSLAEIGVYRGDFAQKILENCRDLNEYYMVDPWRNLKEWNKPANTSNDKFSEFFEEAMKKTDFASHKRKVFKGTTMEIINQIQNQHLDCVYIDGDHTLKGITIDLLNYWKKIKDTGFIIGDDFCPRIWQHEEKFEPTLIFPFAVYFAEAMNVKIFALPFNQFLIKKDLMNFEFINLSNKNYSEFQLKDQIKNKNLK